MKQRNLFRIIIGAFMLGSGLIITVFQPGGFFFGTILITGGCAFLAVGILRRRKYRDGPESDERSKKIGAYGLSYAWLTGIIFISVLYWLDIMGILLLRAQVVLALSLMVLVISAVIYQIYLFQRGDVE
jgi:drug/metabolite transporter (DMT)-like permease